jgi:hypothetical protein
MAPAACAAPARRYVGESCEGVGANKCFGKPEVCAMMFFFVEIGRSWETGAEVWVWKVRGGPSTVADASRLVKRGPA